MAKQNRKITVKRRGHKRRHWPLLISMGLIFVIAAIAAGWQYYRFEKYNLGAKDGNSHTYIVDPNTTIKQVIDMVQQDYQIESPGSLVLHGMLMKWPVDEDGFVRPLSYTFPAKMGSREFVRCLRQGKKVEINLTFTGVRLPSQLAVKLSSQLLNIDSLDIASRLADPEYMAKYGVDIPNAMTIFLPNTYRVFRDITVDELFDRMYDEYNKFWNEDRLAKAKALNLTPQQVATIASIVEEETNIASDKPIIAGLYLNRLRINMPLQSCPTVKFALQDFTIRRVLDKHLEVNSPYNTYKNPGLPPGPIRVPTPATLDAVLNPVKSNYLYMCASTDFDGTHHFSTNYAAHAAYARQYQAALNKLGIK